MKPAPFDYVRAESVEHAVHALTGGDGDAKVLAGGQSLVPLLSMRLARPSVLVDINQVSDLDYVRLDGDVLRIGALTRHRTVETSPEVARHVPLLVDALRYVGHVTIRNRGTIGGSVAHSDPAAELPSVLVALDGRVVLEGPDGRREVAAADFFEGYLTTAAEPDELLTEIIVPVSPRGTGVCVQEQARRHGDFALVAVFSAVSLDAAGKVADVRLGIAGTNATPLRPERAESLLVGESPSEQAIAAAAAAAAAATGSVGDIHATAKYRTTVAEVLTRRALQGAVANTNGHH
ncbi:FAD binding domain-containing protein [Amycolatopsis methanolica]|uniref:Carbon-monoxide dehydrogenase (Acceptor) n=1 Tax=Amycolatopsis methanolica 239 TaxID=1068978 RepID=A0A076MK26_AMYME|nr:xanthine dehydrogenase family protein subunit M [Amycolatopsis methanolica]AIJ21208.1 carbon-monoxide dehydrogenase (Acceptor) [Amycolatopsis methanolica 239]